MLLRAAPVVRELARFQTADHCSLEANYIMQPMPVRIWSAFFFCSTVSAP